MDDERELILIAIALISISGDWGAISTFLWRTCSHSLGVEGPVRGWVELGDEFKFQIKENKYLYYSEINLKLIIVSQWIGKLYSPRLQAKHKFSNISTSSGWRRMIFMGNRA